MKYLYIVNYWVPFPASEFGGLINLIAEDDNEAFDILSDCPDFDVTYTDRIMANVVDAQKFQLTKDYNSGILEQFIT